MRARLIRALCLRRADSDIRLIKRLVATLLKGRTAMSQNKHDDIDENGRKIVYYVSVTRTDWIFYNNWRVRSERRRKITHSVGFVSWDTWELEGSALDFTLLNSLDDGTLYGPFYPEKKVGEGFREYLVENYESSTVVGVKAFYAFRDKEYSVEEGTNWEPESIGGGTNSKTESSLEEETTSEAELLPSRLYVYLLTGIIILGLVLFVYWLR